MRTGLLSMVLGLVVAGAASAAVETANVQWPLDGSTQPAGLDLTVYSRVLKTGCTGNCDLVGCEDLEASLYFRPQGGSWSSVAMNLNTGDCYTPSEEYFGVIPGASMAGSFIDFYVEYHDTADDSYYYADGFDSADPAQYVLSALTTQEFTYHVCLNTCNLPQGTLNPGIAGPFNGWGFTNLVGSIGDEIWCYDLVVPAGSAPNFQFKFRNNSAWESLPGGPFANREYSIAPGSTADADTFLWNDEECAGLPTELVNSLLVVFSVDMSYQDPASYSGGVSIQGDTAPLTWDAGATMMTNQGNGLFTAGLMFPAGSPTNIEFKFTRNDGSSWGWESANNRPLFLDEAGGSPMVVDLQYWDNYQPPQVTTQDVSVTFSVDMNCLDPASYAGGVSVTGGGDVLGNWTPGVNLLTDGNNDGIFETTLVYPAGSGFNWEHKFNLSADGVNWGWEDNVANRPFTISDANTNQVLATVAWDNWLCAPEVTIVRVGNSVQLSWDAVPAAASYNVYGDTDPYFVPAPANLLGSTAGTTYNHVVAGSRLNFKVTANN